MATFKAGDYNFAVVGYHYVNDEAVINNVYGTASYLKNDIYITAAHSIKNASECGQFGVAFTITTSINGTERYPIEILPVDYIELFEDFDLGLIKSKGSNPRAMAYHWDMDPGLIFEDVIAAGYPHGHEPYNNRLVFRGLKGHIVCSDTFHRFASLPMIYELSFHCPRGISGAPITTPVENPKVKGYIIGNVATEIMVFSEREINEESGEITRYEKHETTKFGIAIRISNLLPIASDILGSTFEAYLCNQGLI